MLRVVAVLSLPALALTACTIAPSPAENDSSESVGLIGELNVYFPLVVSGGTNEALAQNTLSPGRYAATLDRLRKDQIVIDIDATEIGDLTVRLREGVGEFPVGSGEFTFTASQHDLPYTIYGVHEVDRTVWSSVELSGDSCHTMVIREYCSTTADGASVCSLVPVTVSGWRERETRVTQESEDFGVTFVDAQAAVVVARYSAFTEPSIVERSIPGACQMPFF